ncbi:hypothetical protein ON010_g15729 [Phytophthora cinnamomi]|nr:hypothetical protein ON010_g15729 [Phytophthora cinnamomi]
MQVLRQTLAACALLLSALVAHSNAASCDTAGTVVMTVGADNTQAIVVDADCSETEVDVSKNALTASSMGIQKVLSAPDVKTMTLDVEPLHELRQADDPRLGHEPGPELERNLVVRRHEPARHHDAALPGRQPHQVRVGRYLPVLAHAAVHPQPAAEHTGGRHLPGHRPVSVPCAVGTLQLERCNPIASIKGVSFPLALTKLDLGTNKITNFEISRSDYSTFKDLETFNAVVAQTSCSTSGAELVAVSGYSICVISDELFQSTYGNSSSKSSSSAESASTTPIAESNSNSTILIVVICLAAVLAVALAAFAFRTYRVRQTKDISQRDMGDNFFANGTLMDTQSHSGQGNHPSNPSNPSNQQNSGSYNTIFSGGKITMMGGTAIESALVKYRVPANEVQIERSIAKGGFGIVFLATYQSRPVVVKKILPEKAADDRCLSAFIDEIKLISSLSHAKIVRFIGVSWSMLSDMAVLMEYMPNGDLDMLLKQQHERQEMYPKEFDWYQNSSVLPAKAAIALDVLEAIVYLHSFPSPIIHRDLKSKNVLLSASYEAKLSDFGVSREWQVDMTMTAGIGTMAWIAPEVLRGERYTEMADIYSFGVILSELATCIKPFDGVTNALIVLKVTSEEKPDLGSNCPEDIRELADRCLSFNPNDRPSASVAHYELRTLLKLHSAFEL